MKFRRMAALAGALVLMGAMASEAVAQRRDRDSDRGGRGGPDREWVQLGEKRVGFRVDRDTINIEQSEDWYRDRAFKRLHFIAEGSEIRMISLRLVYFNGFGEDFRVDRLIRDGEDMPVDLRGDRSFLRRIEMVYRARPSFQGQAVIKVYGEPSRRGSGPGVVIGQPGSGPGGGGGGRDWDELGCRDVSLFGKDRDSIRVGRREGRFKAIRLHVRGADVEILDLKVIYANGQPDDVQVRHFMRQGERSRPFELRGWERSIDRVDMVYRTVPNFKGLAKVCVEGLQ